MSPKRFASLAEQLLRAGVSPRRIGRLLSEIEAHFDDVVMELEASGLARAESEAQAEARLGPEGAFIAGIMARPELRSWARRWPWVAFILFPLLGFALLFVLSMLVMIGVVAFCDHVLGIHLDSRVLRAICAGLVLIALWVAPVGAAGIACLLAAHRRAPILWPIAGCVLVALVGAMTNASFEFRTAVPHGMLSAGIGFPIRGALGSLRVAATLVTILVPFLWFMLPKVRGGRAANAPPSPRQAID